MQCIRDLMHSLDKQERDRTKFRVPVVIWDSVYSQVGSLVAWESKK